MACKPDSVQGLPLWMTIPLALSLPTGSSRQPGSLGAKFPCRHPLPGRRTIPIRRCSRWGLPCQDCYQPRGGLLPHRFTLTHKIRRGEPIGRYLFCGAFRRVAPPGRYPAPSLHGVRTFLGHPAVRRNGAMGTRGHPAIRASLQIGNHMRRVNRLGARRPCFTCQQDQRDQAQQRHDGGKADRAGVKPKDRAGQANPDHRQ